VSRVVNYGLSLIPERLSKGRELHPYTVGFMKNGFARLIVRRLSDQSEILALYVFYNRKRGAGVDKDQIKRRIGELRSVEYRYHGASDLVLVIRGVVFTIYGVRS
jgi:hypothetical protein